MVVWLWFFSLQPLLYKSRLAGASCITCFGEDCSTLRWKRPTRNSAAMIDRICGLPFYSFLFSRLRLAPSAGIFFSVLPGCCLDHPQRIHLRSGHPATRLPYDAALKTFNGHHPLCHLLFFNVACFCLSKTQISLDALPLLSAFPFSMWGFCTSDSTQQAFTIVVTG